MNALSVRQPWAFAIVLGFKPVENRDYSRNHRGPTLIHASKTEEHGHVLGTLLHIADQAKMPLKSVQALYRQRLALGAIVGQVNIVDCVTRHESRWFFGPFGFVMTEPQWCDPFPWRGQLGFFEVPDTVVSKLHFKRQFDAARGDLFA